MSSNVLFRKALIKGQFFLTDPADKQAAADVVPGQVLLLEHEPHNPADPLAVRARTAGGRVGFVQAEISAAIVWFLLNDFAVDCVVLERGKGGNLVVNIGVTAP